MALIKCPECEKEISDKANSCPSCGFPIARHLASIEAEKRREQAEKERMNNTNSLSEPDPIKKENPIKTKEKSYGFIPLLISAGIGMFYICFSIPYWINATAGMSDPFEALGAGIATALVVPHLICVVLAVIFNAVAACMMKPGFALTGGILYAVAMVLFLPYFMFVIVEMILSFVGFARMKKQ